MRTITSKGKTCLFRFENLIDIPDYIKATKSDGKKIQMTQSIDNADSFNGGVSHEGAINLVYEGWEKGAQKVEAVRTKQTGMIANGYANVERAGLVRSYAGGIPNVAEAIAGLPNPYRRFVSRPVKTKVLDLWWMVNARCDRRASQFIDQGVALLAAIDQVESTGVRVGVNIFSATLSQGRAVGWSCQVKRFSERLQIPEIAFPVAHAAYFRRLGFSLIERQGTTDRVEPFKWGYGTPLESEVNVSKTLATKLKGLVPENALVVTPYYDDTVKDAYDKILAQLNKAVEREAA